MSSTQEVASPIWVIPGLERFERRVLKYACNSGQRGESRPRKIWIDISIVRLGARDDLIGEEMVVVLHRLYRTLGHQGTLDITLSEDVIYDTGGWGCRRITNADISTLQRMLAQRDERNDRSDG